MLFTEAEPLVMPYIKQVVNAGVVFKDHPCKLKEMCSCKGKPGCNCTCPCRCVWIS